MLTMTKKLLALAAALAAAPLAPVQAQSVEDFYKGAQIDFIVANAAGTSYDAWARVLANHMPKYMPGHPTFVVRAMPGAGSLQGATYLYSHAPHDGLTIGIMSQNIPLSAFLKAKPGFEDMNFTRFNWIGSTDTNFEACVIRPDAKVKTAADTLTTEALMGGNGAGSQISLIPNFMNAVLDTKFKVIEGYASANEILLAIDRKELDGMCQTYGGIRRARPGAIEKGELNLLVSLEEQPIPGTNAPTAHTLVKNAEQKQILTFFNLSANIGRPVVAPPEVPKDRIEALRKAFDAAVKDPEFLAEAEKQKLEAVPNTAAEEEAKYAKILATPPDVVKKTVQYLGD
jgi:tripartite-type tricarboxylate transporter receptor subunit TctC